MRWHVEPYRRKVDSEWVPVRNKWKVIIDYGMQLDPEMGKKRRQREVYYFNGGKREAEADAQARVERMRKSAVRIAPMHGTVGEWLDEWLRDYVEPRGQQGELAASTVAGYRGHVRRYLKPELGSIELKRLKPEDVTAMYKKMALPRSEGGYGVSARTRELAHVTLRVALGKAVQLGRMRFNVLDKGRGVDRPKVKRRTVTAMESDDAVRLMQALASDSGDGRRLYVPALIALATGMRRGEILALRRDDVRLSPESEPDALGMITVCRAWDKEDQVTLGRSPVERYRVKEWPKSGKERYVDIPPELSAVLRAIMAEQDERREAAGELWFTSASRADGTVISWGDLLVTDDHGFPWWPDSFSAAWLRWCKEHGFSVRFHDLRATSGSLSLAAGVDPEVVRQRLGHHSAAFFLERYAKAMHKARERDAAIIGSLVTRAVVPNVGAGDGSESTLADALLRSSAPKGGTK